MIRVLSSIPGAQLIATPSAAAQRALRARHGVIRSKSLGRFNSFGAALPADYQPPLPRKVREIYGIWDIGLHKSNKASGGDVDVVEILKKYDYNDTRGWVEYCDKMYDRSDPRWAKCQQIACDHICFEPEGQMHSPKLCCEHPNLPGFVTPFSIAPGMLLPPWEDFGVGARGLPKPEAGIMADVGQMLTIDWDDYTPLKLWQTFWANPAKFAIMLAKLNIIPVFGAAVTIALTATVIPFALLPFAIDEAKKLGKNPDKEVLDPVWKHAKKSIGLVLKYIGKCGIGINVLCGAGLIVQRAAQDMIDDGTLDLPPDKGGMYDPTAKAIVAFLAKSGDKMVDAIANSIGDIWSGGLFAVMESGFAAARDAVDVPATKKILDMLRLVCGIGNVIASGIAAQKPFEVIADDIGEKVLGFRPSVFFAMAKAKSEAALNYAQTSLSLTGGSLDKMGGLIDGLGTMFDQLIKALSDLSNLVGGGLDELIKMFDGARSGLTAAANATTAVIAGVNDTATAVGVQPDGTLFAPGGINLNGRRIVDIPASVRAKFVLAAAKKGAGGIAVSTGTGVRRAGGIVGVIRGDKLGITPPPAGVNDMTLVVNTPPPPRAIPNTPPPPKYVPPLPQKAAMSYVPILAGVAGFFVGGPLGAAAGVAIGATLGGKPKSSSVAGFGNYQPQYGRQMHGFGLMRAAVTSPGASEDSPTSTSAQAPSPVVVVTPSGPRVIDARAFRTGFRPGVVTGRRLAPALNLPAPVTIAPTSRFIGTGEVRVSAPPSGGSGPSVVGGGVATVAADYQADPVPVPVVNEDGSTVDPNNPPNTNTGGDTGGDTDTKADPNAPADASNTILLVGGALAAVLWFSTRKAA